MYHDDSAGCLFHTVSPAEMTDLVHAFGICWIPRHGSSVKRCLRSVQPMFFYQISQEAELKRRVLRLSRLLSQNRKGKDSHLRSHGKFDSLTCALNSSQFFTSGPLSFRIFRILSHLHEKCPGEPLSPVVSSTPTSEIRTDTPALLP